MTVSLLFNLKFTQLINNKGFVSTVFNYFISIIYYNILCINEFKDINYLKI